MSLSLGILPEGIRDRDGPISEILPVHSLNGSIAGLEAGVVDEGIAFAVARVGVTHDLRCLQNHPKRTEGVIQKFLVHLGVEVAYKKIGSHIEILLIRRGLVDADGLAVQLDHVQYLDGIVCVLLPQQLDKAIALMVAGHAVLGHMQVDYWTSLKKQFVENFVGDSIIQVAHIACGLLVTFNDMARHVAQCYWALRQTPISLSKAEK